MVAIFVDSTKRGGATMAFPDVCLTPKSGESLGSIPYPNAKLISVNKDKSVKKVFDIKSGFARELQILNVENSPTFIVFDDGLVLTHNVVCLSPKAARKIFVSEIGVYASATVISIGKDENAPFVFRVTRNSVRRMYIDVKSAPIIWSKR